MSTAEGKQQTAPPFLSSGPSASATFSGDATIAAGLADLNKQLCNLQVEIKKVEAQIKNAAKNISDAKTDKETERWWEEKKQLREKEKQLREKELILLQRGEQSTDQKVLLSTPVKKRLELLEKKVDRSLVGVEDLTARIAGRSPFRTETTKSRRKKFNDVYKELTPKTKDQDAPLFVRKKANEWQEAKKALTPFFSPNQHSVSRGDSEAALQSYGNGQFKRFLRENKGLTHWDTSAVHLLPSGSQPDNVFTAGDFYLGSATVVVDVEWKTYPKSFRKGGFTDDEKGQVINYALELLDAQPWRRFIVVATCNLDWIQFFRVAQDESVAEFRAVKFLTGPGRLYLAALLSSSYQELGYAIPQPKALKLDAWQPFEGGATSVVYRSEDSGKILKVHHDRRDTEREKDIYAKLSLGNVTHIPSLLRTGENWLELTDHGRQISTGDPSYLIVDVIKALKSAHDAGWVHRDVRPANITVKGGKATLIDWGFAVPSDQKNQSFAGTRSFASDHVLDQPDKYRPQDDLHSAVRTLIYLKELHGSRICRSPEKEKLKAFWKKMKVPKIYRDASTLAEQLDYDRLITMFACTTLSIDPAKPG